MAQSAHRFQFSRQEPLDDVTRRLPLVDDFDRHFFRVVSCTVRQLHLGIGTTAIGPLHYVADLVST